MEGLHGIAMYHANTSKFNRLEQKWKQVTEEHGKKGRCVCVFRSFELISCPVWALVPPGVDLPKQLEQLAQ